MKDKSLKFSANLGFLWADRPLPEAVRDAARAGFDAVEFHWPYHVPPEELRKVLEETGLPVLSLNTVPGDASRGEFGLAALPGREDEARSGFVKALDYARRIGAHNIHVMAGIAQGESARAAFIDNLCRGRDLAFSHGIALLIEPINRRDVPGYFLENCDQAAKIIEACGEEGIHIMFDCYHQQIISGDLISRMRQHLSRIGHVQFAAIPDRGEPDRGEVNYAWLLPAMREAGYNGYFGAEYRPRDKTDAGLAWIERLSRSP